MWIGVVTLFPEMFEFLNAGGVVKRAIDAGHVTVSTFNPRDFARDRHRSVDDKPYGGGAGMVMMVEPLADCLGAARKAAPRGSPVVLLSPQGVGFDQAMAQRTSGIGGLILVCGRYEGVDERFVEAHVDLEWSIGDYVLSGGELAAMVVADAIARHIPGTLGNRLSVLDESHLDGTLEYPQYTRPENCDGRRVPEVLLSGDHRRVEDYRRQQALQRTYMRRPELLTRTVFSARDRDLLQQVLPVQKEASHA